MFASAEKISTKEVKQNMGTQNEVFDAEVMGEQLKKLRKKVKLSQEKFAERMGMSKDTIYNYEKGKCLRDTVRSMSMRLLPFLVKIPRRV